jgi:MFS family permease
MGYGAANAQLMTIPLYVMPQQPVRACPLTISYAVSAVLAFATAIVSDRIRMRGPFVMIGFSVTFLGMLIVYLLPSTTSAGVRYFFSLWILAGIYMGFPSVLSWLSNNTAGVKKRNTATTLQLGIANFATAIGTNSYTGAEAPRYPTGFGVGMVGPGQHDYL